MNEGLRLAIEAAPTGMILVDGRGRIALLNRQVAELFSYGPRELIGKPIEVLLPERFRAGHPALREGYSQHPAGRLMALNRDVHGLRKDGTEVAIQIGLNPLQTPEGRFVLTSVVDISERKRVQRERDELLRRLQATNAGLEDRVRARTAELEATVREREVLLKEVHHRVKNNLQVISSLISMQSRALGADAGRDALVDVQARIRAIALIHDKLYESPDYGRVSFAEYVRGLAADVFQATQAAGVSPGKVSLELAVEDVDMAVSKAIPCGLILNELITNALRHAFPRDRKGRLRVELSRADGSGLRLAVIDDGVGLPAGVDFRTATSLGLQLVQMLARQLDAGLEVETTGGTCVRLTVPGPE